MRSANDRGIDEQMETLAAVVDATRSEVKRLAETVRENKKGVQTLSAIALAERLGQLEHLAALGGESALSCARAVKCVDDKLEALAHRLDRIEKVIGGLS